MYKHMHAYNTRPTSRFVGENNSCLECWTMRVLFYCFRLCLRIHGVGTLNDEANRLQEKSQNCLQVIPELHHF